jgi:hypothetical protein
VVVENAGGHGRNPNGILGLLCREHFHGLAKYAGVMGPAYTFDHYIFAPDAVDRDGREFNKMAGEARVVGKSYYNVKYIAFVAHS